MLRHQNSHNEIAKIFTPKLRRGNRIIRSGMIYKSKDLISQFQSGFDDLIKSSWDFTSPAFFQLGKFIKLRNKTKSSSPNLLNAWVDWRQPTIKGYIPLLGLISWGKPSVVKQSLQKCISLAKEYF